MNCQVSLIMLSYTIHNNTYLSAKIRMSALEGTHCPLVRPTHASRSHILPRHRIYMGHVHRFALSWLERVRVLKIPSQSTQEPERVVDKTLDLHKLQITVLTSVSLVHIYQVYVLKCPNMYGRNRAPSSQGPLSYL
jgi:hypothetical protein